MLVITYYCHQNLTSEIALIGNLTYAAHNHAVICTYDKMIRLYSWSAVEWHYKKIWASTYKHCLCQITLCAETRKGVFWNRFNSHRNKNAISKTQVLILCKRVERKHISFLCDLMKPISQLTVN